MPQIKLASQWPLRILLSLLPQHCVYKHAYAWLFKMGPLGKSNSFFCFCFPDWTITPVLVNSFKRAGPLAGFQDQRGILSVPGGQTVAHLPFASHSLLPPLLITTALGKKVPHCPLAPSASLKTSKSFDLWKLLLLSPYGMQMRPPRLEATT